MDSRAWDESESRDQYLHLLHTLTIGVTRTCKIALQNSNVCRRLIEYQSIIENIQ